MTSLVLELAPGDDLLINGASIRFGTKAKIALTRHARFVFGKQVMRTEDATTPLRRLYLHLQAAYAGPEEDFGDNMAMADEAAGELYPSSEIADAMDQAHDGEFWPALKSLRSLIREQDAEPIPDPDLVTVEVSA